MNNTTQTTQDTSSHKIRANLLKELISGATAMLGKFQPYSYDSLTVKGRCTQLTHDINLLQAICITEVSAANMKDISSERSEPLQGTDRVSITPKGKALLNERSEPLTRFNSLPVNTVFSYHDKQYIKTHRLYALLVGDPKQPDKNFHPSTMVHRICTLTNKAPAINNEERVSNLRASLREYADNAMISNPKNQANYLLDLLDKYEGKEPQKENI